VLGSSTSGLTARVGSTFRALRNYNYRLFWGGQFVSLTGDWIQRAGMSWLVLDLTGSPLQLGTVTMLQFLPISLFAIFGGVLADRLPKRRVLVLTQLGICTDTIILAALVSTGTIQLWQLYILAVFQGLFQAVDAPTRQAFVMELVGRDDLANAVALNSCNFNLSRILGPAVGGVLIASVGTAICFWLNAASYLPVIAALALMRPAAFHAVPPPIRGRVLRQLGEGLVYAARTPAVFGVLLVVATFGAFGFNFITILPLLARYAYDAGPQGYGVLSSFLGIGSLTAALVVAGRQRATRGFMLMAGLIFATLLVLLGANPWYGVGAVLLLLMGMASIAFSATNQTLVQYAAPGQLRGRVMGVYTVLAMGMTPIGALTLGGLSELAGIRVALGAVGALCALGTLTAWLYLRHRLGRAAFGAD
jgi:MFS family permease